ncbi:class II fructose-bisphosphatase [Marinicrinis lubricantis]|uniref:Fructose-1,6-bisphosphatase n=1 Tax=Marinicrinis lubricantis TaxID=2086470 RepID=A0ABW1IL17_9BACL
MERELALEIVRVTEHAALASAPWIGRGNKHQADDAATAAMRTMFETVAMQGTVVIGEGEMDEAPMLYIGERVGDGSGPRVDVAVDPLEGTEIVAKGLDHAMSVIAIAPTGHILHAPDIYMEKLAAGPRLRGKLDLRDPLDVTLRKAAEELAKPVEDLTVMILERDRHAAQIQTLRQAGVKIILLNGGDVAGAMAPAFEESGVDLYVGSGGAPEGVLAAAALSCIGGEIQGRLMPSNPVEYQRCLNMGLSDPSKVLMLEDMVGNDDVIFAATGITPGRFLEGVKWISSERIETHSIVMRAKTQTIRYVTTQHYMPKKQYFLKQASNM